MQHSSKKRERDLTCSERKGSFLAASLCERQDTENRPVNNSHPLTLWLPDHTWLKDKEKL